MHVASLHSYPIKGGYRLDHDGVEVEIDGIPGDRRWLVTDPDGSLITQTDVARLGQVRSAPAGTGLTLSAPGMPDLTVAGAGSEADDWLSAALDRKVHLVRLERRPPGENPLLVTTTASLGALNDRLLESGSPEGPLPMTRFRPNVVLSDVSPWAEDAWIGGRIRIGGLVFRVTEACERCVITTIDQETGERGREPLRVLARFRNIDQGLLFGVYLAAEVPGRLAVGDTVEVPAGSWPGMLVG